MRQYEAVSSYIPKEIWERMLAVRWSNDGFLRIINAYRKNKNRSFARPRLTKLFGEVFYSGYQERMNWFLSRANLLVRLKPLDKRSKIKCRYKFYIVRLIESGEGFPKETRSLAVVS